MRKLLLTLVGWLFFALSSLHAQTREVTGKVTDAKDGSPLAGVSVTTKSGRGTQTLLDGSFKINVAATDKTLTITGIGFKPMTVDITGDFLSLKLEADQRVMSEIIVTGYSTQSKRKTPGSVAKISAEDIRQVPIGSFDQALQGQAPGVLVQANSGQPGAAARIAIRGKGSLVGSTDPLYIVDGIQINANDFQTINPNDFESISILKDASSTAIYGSRGANGVVLITTKRGRNGKTTVTYDVQYGTSTLPENKLKVMNSSEKIEYELANGNPYGWSQAEADDLSKVNTNWDDVFFQKGITKSHQISLAGGNEKTKFFVSGGIFDQTGTVKTTDLKRYTGRANLETVFGDFKLDFRTSFGYSKLRNTIENSAFIGAPLNAALWLNPYEKPYDDNGDYTVITSGQPHPLQELLENKFYNNQIKGVASLGLDWKIPFLTGLVARTNWGIDYTSDEIFNYIDRTTYQGSIATGRAGSLGRSLGYNFRYTGTTSLGYSTKVGEHDFSIALYNEIVEGRGVGFGFTGFGLLTPFQNESGITPGTNTNGFIPTVNGSVGDNGLLSYFADLNYGFRNKYFLNAAYRYDGSSRFGADKRWASFGSVGVSWIISEEKFMDRLREKFLDDLKLKVSYGSVGNQALSANFPSLAQLGRATYGGNGGLALNSFAIPDLQWEAKTTFNTGIEFSFFKGRLSGGVEFYNAVTSDLFLNKQISNTSGASTILTNIGKLRNRGIEVGLRGDVVKTKDFKWSLNATVTNNKNEILELVDGKTEEVTGSTIRKVGSPINNYYLVKYAGVDPDNGDALYYKKGTKTTTNIYDPSDREEIGTSDAPTFGGFGTDISYKGLNIGVLFSFVQGNKIYNNDRNNLVNPGYLFDNLSREVLDEWRTPGQITNVPNPSNPYFAETTRFIEDGSFVRLRNVVVSYDLPSNLIKRWKMSTLRVFVQGQNLFTWTDYLGYDPELTTGTSIGARYPALRTATVGLTVGF
jgi:TonB-dependent starch-binding outer membrane protein SusC